MGIWKDKNGLHQQVSDPTVVEDTLEQMNRIEQQKRTMSFANQMQALKETKLLRNKMIQEMGVDPDPKNVVTRGQWMLDEDA